MRAKPRPARKERVLKGEDVPVDMEALEEIRAAKEAALTGLEVRACKNHSTLGWGRGFRNGFDWSNVRGE